MRNATLMLWSIAACTTSPEGLAGPDTCIAEQLTADATVAERATHTFDARGRIIKTDWEQHATTPIAAHWTYDYDALDRPIFVHSMQSGDVAATYGDSTVTVGYGTSETYRFDLGAGLVLHEEGPLEAAAAMRNIFDYTYDANGHVTAETLQGFDDEIGRTMTATTITYDARGRIAGFVRTSTIGTTSTEDHVTMTYVDTADGWSVRRSGTTSLSLVASFAFAGNRLVRSAIDENDDGIDDWYATYTYDDASPSVSATDVRPSNGTAGRSWRLRGRCAGSPGVATSVTTGTPMIIPATDVRLPNPGAAVVSP
jgi:hypothetical protein